MLILILSHAVKHVGFVMVNRFLQFQGHTFKIIALLVVQLSLLSFAELRCYQMKEGTQFTEDVPIEYAEDTFESRPCEIFQDSCVTVTYWCSSNSGTRKFIALNISLTLDI